MNKMNKWKAYGSVSDLVKQFETNRPQNAIDLKKSQSLENIKKSQNFKNIYHKFENKEPDAPDSNLIQYSSTNHLECLQLQEINQAKKKLLEITSALGPNSNVDAYPGYLQELSELILNVGNVSDYGHASIKSEKAQILPLLHRCYLVVRDKLKGRNYGFDEDESMKLLMLRRNDLGERKSPPKPLVRTRSVNSGKLGNGNSDGEGKKSLQRKYERNPTNQHASNSNPDSKNSTSISRRISKLQASVNQSAQLPPKIKTVYELRNQNENPNTSNWNSTNEDGSNNVSKFKPIYPVTLRKAKSFNSNQPRDPYGDKDKWETASNQSENSGYNYRNSWHNFRNSLDVQSQQDNYDTESDTASIVSGHDMFEQKYSGIAERINKVLKKRITMLEEDGLLS